MGDSGAYLARLLLMREAIASVSLSHPESCRCDTCQAADGDEAAFARVMYNMMRTGGSHG